MINSMAFRTNNILCFAGTIDKENLSLMKKAIAEDC
jgi:hypothetical protein